MRDLIKAAMTIVSAFIVANCNSGCKPALQAAQDLENEYRQKVLECVQKAPNAEAGRQCWYDVNESYGLCKPSKMPELGMCREDSMSQPVRP